MTYEQLLAMARRAEGKTLETVTGKRFTVGIYLDCPFFTLESTGRGQSDGRAAAERFVARFNQIGSLRPGDYAGVTRSASYYVALILELGTSAAGTRCGRIERRLQRTSPPCRAISTTVLPQAPDARILGGEGAASEFRC